MHSQLYAWGKLQGDLEVHKHRDLGHVFFVWRCLVYQQGKEQGRKGGNTNRRSVGPLDSGGYRRVYSQPRVVPQLWIELLRCKPWSQSIGPGVSIRS
jgi:hypothetical protein